MKSQKLMNACTEIRVGSLYAVYGISEDSFLFYFLPVMKCQTIVLDCFTRNYIFYALHPQNVCGSSYRSVFGVVAVAGCLSDTYTS